MKLPRSLVIAFTVLAISQQATHADAVYAGDSNALGSDYGAAYVGAQRSTTSSVGPIAPSSTTVWWFAINGMPYSSYTEWYVTTSGGTAVDTDNLTLYYDPQVGIRFTTAGTYTIRAEIWNNSSKGTWLQAHRFTVTVVAPEIDVRGNSISIVDGDTTPSTSDYTDFGSTVVGTTVTRRFYVHNTGTAALAPGAISLPSGYTLTVGLISSIAAGSSDYFDVRLNASAVGTYAGDISIPNNDSNENPYNFRITGRVIGVPEIDVRGNSISIVDGDTTPSTSDYTSFGSTTVGTTLTRRFYVYNTGTAALTPGAITLPSGYTLAVGLISSIAAGSSDYFDVSLNATAAGTYAGDISIPNNDSNENPYNFRITGTVITPQEIDVRGNSVTIVDGDATPTSADYTDFGSTPVGTTVTRTFYVYNTGTAALTTGPITVPSGYTLTKGLAATFTAGGSDYLTVRLDATAAGTYAGDISIPNNDANENPYNFRITGTVNGLPEMDVRGNSVSIVDGDTTPSPTDGTDFGSTPVGTTVTRRFYVYNTGTAALTPGAITLPSGYTLAVGLISSIAAGGSDYFEVRLNATAAGNYAGDISIPNNDSNENPYNFRITGTVVAPPAPEILSVTYPTSITLGTWATVTVQVRNNGGAASDGGISVSIPSFTAAGDTAYVEDSGSGSGDTPAYREFPQGSTIWTRGASSITASYMLVEYADDNWTGTEVNTLQFRVQPKVAGNFTFNVRSAMGANGAYFGTPTSGPTDQQDWWVTQRTITVAAAAPEMDVRGNSISIVDGDTTPSTSDYTDFGSTTVGTTVSRSFWVHNTGTAPLTPGTISLPSGYTLTVGLISSIAAGGSDYFTVRFNAASVGTFTGDISIPNNDANENPYNFRITGTAGAAPITQDAYESDNTAGTAKTISNGATQSRNIHAVGNVDWVKFTIGQAGAQNLRLETDGASGDSQVWLYGPNSSTTQVTGGYSDDEGNGLFSLLVSGVNGLPATLSPGIYYIKITEYNNDGTIPSYTLAASWTEIPVGLTPDASEADDSAGAAKTISNGATQNRNIHAVGNVDWVRFTVGQGGAQNVRLETDGASGDSQIWLYGPNNSTTQVAYDDDDGNGLFSLITTAADLPATLPPGTYYIKITEFNNDGNIPAYTLRASWTEVTVDTTTDAYEADDTAGAAKTISNGQTQSRNIHAVGNADWIRFTVGQGGAQNVRLETAGASGDSQMWLFGPNSSTTQAAYDDDDGNGAFSLITTAADLPATLPPGIYYIKVTEYNNDGTIPAYTLSASWTEVSVGIITPDAYEADDGVGTAKTISNGQTQNRNIHAAGNLDWIKFTVDGGGAQNVRLETDGPSGDTQMWLYGPNSSTTQVPGGFDDDDGNGAFSLLVSGQQGMPATLAPGTYYIGVQEYNNDETIPAYTLRVSWTATSLATPLNASQVVSSLIGGQGSMQMYKISVPSGQTLLNVQIWGGSGDADLYLRYNTPPTQSIYDHRSRLSGNLERVSVALPASGDWYVLVYGQTAYNGLNLMAKVSQENPADFFRAVGGAYIGNALAPRYSSGMKDYAFLGFTIPNPLDWGFVSIFGAGAQMSFDLHDYFQVTPEGYTGDWVTMHIQFAYSYISASIVPFDVGVFSRQFGGSAGAPDREFPADLNIVNATIGPLKCTYFQFDSDGTLTSNLLAGDNPFGFDTFTVNIGFSLVEGLSQSASIELQRHALDLATRNAFGINPAIDIMGDMLKEEVFHPTQRITIGGQEYPMPRIGFRFTTDASDASQ